jgi:hypothetical protein
MSPILSIHPRASQPVTSGSNIGELAVKNKLAAFFIKEKAEGTMPPEADADALADFCIATVQGAMLMGKIKRSSQLVETPVREALSHVRRSAIAEKPRTAASSGTRAARPS